jgi:3'-phosphoadenosine 5'-phosphosulfate (PAPS) 3'-phosphatase
MPERRRAATIIATLDRELEIAMSVALDAADVLRRHRTAPLDVGRKAGGEVVTAADLEADAVIRAGLANTFPDDAISSEPVRRPTIVVRSGAISRASSPRSTDIVVIVPPELG